MAALTIAENLRPRSTLPHLQKTTPRIDMTPMVDLGFLLICFFVITTTMTEPRVTDLYMPAEGPPLSIGDSKVMTVLLDKDNRIFYYHGNWPDARKNNAIFTTGYSSKSGLGSSIRQRQERIGEIHAGNGGRKGFMLIIKATDKASYKNLIDVLDETLINDVRHYAMLPVTLEEREYLATQQEDR